MAIRLFRPLAVVLLALLALPAPRLPANLPLPIEGASETACKRGADLFQKEEFQEAIAAYTEAVKVDPHNYKAFIGRSAVHSRLQHADKAAEDYERAIRASPTSDEALQARASERYAAEHYEDAIRDLDAAVQISPGDYELYHWRGAAHLALGHREQAIADFTKELAHDPGNIALNGMDFYNRAVAHFQLGQNEEALADYEKANAAGDNNIAERGQCLIGLKRWRKAADIFDEVLQNLADPTPDNADARYAALCDRAVARTGLKDYEGSESDLTAAMALKPKEALAYGNAAWTRVLARKIAPAREAALTALEIDPSQTWVEINLAHAYLFEGKIKEAEDLYYKDKDKEQSPGKTHAQAVLEDFADLRDAGIDDPRMAPIEKRLREAPKAPPAPAASPTPLPPTPAKT